MNPAPLGVGFVFELPGARSGSRSWGPLVEGSLRLSRRKLCFKRVEGLFLPKASQAQRSHLSCLRHEFGNELILVHFLAPGKEKSGQDAVTAAEVGVHACMRVNVCACVV